MKKLYFAFGILCCGFSVNAQIVNIPDPVFKQMLVTSNSSSNICAFDLNNNAFAVDANSDGEIQLAEALLVGHLELTTNNDALPDIVSLQGIQSFANLITLSCLNNDLVSVNVSGLANLLNLDLASNQITSLNVSGCNSLMEIRCTGNQLTSLDVSGLPVFHILNCSFNPLTSLNVSGSNLLTQVHCSYTDLVTVDVSNLSILSYLSCDHMPQLTTIFAKNGSNEQYQFQIDNSPNLSYICVDDSQVTTIQNLANSYGYNCTVNPYCSFTPGGNYFTIQGNSVFDAAGDGCGSSDLAFPAMKFSYVFGAVAGHFFSDASGNFQLDVPAGNYTIAPVLENPNYFVVTPSNATISFPTQSSPYAQNFCIKPNGTRNDLEVTLLPITVARPGFDATYKIVYKNKGTHPKTGNVTLTFEDDIIDFVSSNPSYTSLSTNVLSWDYANLLPFETREIMVTLNVNSPVETPAVTIGDELNFSAVVNPVAADLTAIDNTSALKQPVVGSYDPNDKTCIEGTSVSTTVIGQYVHYLIRFENTGNYPAENVVVRDLIDASKFVVASLMPVSSSHPMEMRFTYPNKVEFIFKNIDLPFDDANNDGYVAFKIKTRTTLVTGNTFSNSANIYFDYNLPIITNTATSTIETLANADFVFSDYFALFPNPVKEVLTIESQSAIEIKSISVYNVLGQLVLAVPNAVEVVNIDVTSLEAGAYFIKINSDKGMSSGKFIKE